MPASGERTRCGSHVVVVPASGGRTRCGMGMVLPHTGYGATALGMVLPHWNGATALEWCYMYRTDRCSRTGWCCSRYSRDTAWMVLPALESCCLHWDRAARNTCGGHAFLSLPGRNARATGSLRSSISGLDRLAWSGLFGCVCARLARTYSEWVWFARLWLSCLFPI